MIKFNPSYQLKLLGYAVYHREREHLLELISVYECAFNASLDTKQSPNFKRISSH